MKLKLIVSLTTLLLAISPNFQTAHAVLAPDIQAEIDRKHQQRIEEARKLATEVVDIYINTVEQRGRWYVLKGRVMDVIRSEHGIKVDDAITIEYMDISAANRRYNTELELNQTPGPGFKPVLYLPEINDTARAWLTNHPKKPHTFTLAADIGSFTKVSWPGKGRDPCEENSMGPLTSQLKACAEQNYQVAKQRLEELLIKIRQSLDSAGSAGDQGDVAVRQQKYLTSSMQAWKQYRDDTCRLVYMEHYPGSNARLHDLDCMTSLTEGRIRQLNGIFFPGESDE